MNEQQINYYESLGFATKSGAFKRYKSAGLLENIDEDFVEEVKQYWANHYDKEIDPSLPVAFANLTGKKDVRVAYPKIVLSDFIPYFNNQTKTLVYQDKNLYDKLIPSHKSVETVLKRMHGLYFSMSNDIMDEGNVITEIKSYKEDMIIKPSDANNGVGIRKLVYKDDKLLLDDEELTLESLEERYGANFAVQKVIQQHPVMAAPHPSSVNSLRMVTLRWKNEVRYLLTFARFGAGNRVQDNAGAGGVCVGVTDEGKFLNSAVDEAAVMHKVHPTTGFAFEELTEIPNFDQFKQYVIDLHKEIAHHDFVSWDIAVGTDGLPVFIEANFKGATWLYQLASEEPLFRDLTDEILEYIAKDRNDRNSPRYRRLAAGKRRTSVNSLRNRIKTLKAQNEKVENINKELRRKQKSSMSKQNEKKEVIKEIEDTKEDFNRENKNLLKERDYYKKELEKMKKSNSWRVTSPIRIMSSRLKKK